LFLDFETYGPFLFAREAEYVSRDALRDFWDEVEETARGLEDAVGVYVISVRGRGSLKPWYVGKTDKGFRKRFAQHAFELKLFSSLHGAAPHGAIEVHLLARMTPRRKGFRAPARKKVPSIDRLEDLLIGTCYSRNPLLLNTSKLSYKKRLRVPGYLHDKPGKPSGAASSLRSLLF